MCFLMEWISIRHQKCPLNLRYKGDKVLQSNLRSLYENSKKAAVVFFFCTLRKVDVVGLRGKKGEITEVVFQEKEMQEATGGCN